MTARRVGAVAAAAFLGAAATSAALLASAAPAHASNRTSTISCPATTGGAANGSYASAGRCAGPVTGTAGDGSVAVAASITCDNGLGLGCGSVSFAVSRPSGDTTDQPIPARSASRGTLTITVPAGYANGTYSASLAGNGASATASFTLDVPPSTPGSPGVDTTTPGQATVTWAASRPTAASSYAVTVDGASTTLTPDCSAGTSCTATVTDLAAGDHTFTVIASRPDGSGGQVSSSSSSTATVTAVPPSTGPTTGPTSGTGGSGGTGSSGGGSTGGGSTGGGNTGSGSTGGGSTGTVTGTKGGTTGTTKTGTAGSTTSSAGSAAAAVAAAAAAQHRAETFQSFAPAAGIAQLPPLPKFPAATGGAADDGEPTDPGTYVPTLPYDGQQTVTEKVSKPTLLGHVTDAAGDRQLLESVAAAALVLMLAAHVRLVARRDPAADL